MRHYLKKLIITIISLYLAHSLVPTITLGQDPKNTLIIIASFLLISILIKPIFSLVLLPLNFATIGIISLALNTIAIFALVNTLPGVSVAAYNFPGATVGGITFQAISFNQVTTIILIALIITVSQKVLHIIFE